MHLLYEIMMKDTMCNIAMIVKIEVNIINQSCQMRRLEVSPRAHLFVRTRPSTTTPECNLSNFIRRTAVRMFDRVEDHFHPVVANSSIYKTGIPGDPRWSFILSFILYPVYSVSEVGSFSYLLTLNHQVVLLVLRPTTFVQAESWSSS